MNNACKLKVRRYSDHMVYPNKYLTVFLGGNSSDKIGEKELNENILNIIPNG